MAKLPSLTGKKVLGALKRGGFRVVRIRGSHHMLRHPDGRTTVVPIHAGEGIGPGLLGKILADVEMTREQLLDLL